ncbi:MAG: hypothetical protein ACOCQD_00845 [archaeon]
MSIIRNKFKEHGIAGYESPATVTRQQMYGTSKKEKNKMNLKKRIREALEAYRSEKKIITPDKKYKKVIEKRPGEEPEIEVSEKMRENRELYEDFLDQMLEEDDCPTCDEKFRNFMEEEDVEDEMYDEEEDTQEAGVGEVDDYDDIIESYFEETDDIVDKYMHDDDDTEPAGEGEENEYEGPDEGEEFNEWVFYEDDDVEDEMYDEEKDTQEAGVGEIYQNDYPDPQYANKVEESEGSLIDHFFSLEESDDLSNLRNPQGNIPIFHPDDPDVETATGGVWDYLGNRYVEDFMQGLPRTGHYYDEVYVPRQERKTYRRHPRFEIP